MTSAASGLRIASPLKFFERVGRMALDLGVGGFLEKFEEHFGRWPTKVLLTLIGLAISAICLGVIWQYLVSPVLAFFRVPGRLLTLTQVMVGGAMISAGSVLALNIYDWYLRRKVSDRPQTRQQLQFEVKAVEKFLAEIDKKQAARIKRRQQERDQS